MRSTTSTVVDLPGGSTRDVVALARISSLERASVAAVLSGLAAVFDDR